MSMMTADETAAALRRLGVPEDKIQGRALGIPIRVVSGSVVVQSSACAPAWPLRLRLPWSVLVSDNEKHVAKLIMVNGKPKAIRTITGKYATAMQSIAALATEAMVERRLCEGPMRATVIAYMPDNRPHDMTNWSKILWDSLERIVYRNDCLLHEVTYRRGGVDVDAPRAEIEIRPLTQGSL